MAYVTTFTLPPTGEMQDSARLVSWQVQPGQTFARDQVLFEIETDKSVIEIPAPQEGKLLEQLVAVDAVIDMDTPLARLEFEGEVPVADEPALKLAPTSAPTAKVPTATPSAAPAQTPSHGRRQSATPAARSALRASGLDIQKIEGTGPAGRITLADVTRAAPTASNAKPVTGTQVVKTRHGGIRVRIWEPTQAQATSTSIVLIHGLFADIEAWASLALNLSRSGQRVVALDLPGHGQSDARVDHFDQIVESAADVLSHAAGKRQVIVGHSFGALVAARLARSNVSATQALVLIAPMGLGTEIAHPFLKGVMHAGNNEAMARELAKLNHAGTKPSDSYMDELRSRIESRRELLTRMIGAVDREGVQQVCISESLQSLACPITVLHGRADVIIPWQHALNAPSRAALHLIPDVGHMPQWEAATLTTEAILRAARSTPTQA